MEDVVVMSEKLELLSANHFGGQPGRATKDSVHLLVKTVKEAWRRGEVASVLFLDVKGAFPSVEIARLQHNMRMRGVLVEYTEWMGRHLEGRTATI
jgi:Reverse transcriptase (RNA-dependent DNA polymerase)